MKKDISNSLKEHYRKTILTNGPSPKGVDWRDESTSDIRHNCMRNLLTSINKDSTLLDVGCGYGAFLDYLKKQNININYQGVDIVEEMLIQANIMHPNANFKLGNFLEEDFDSLFDYVVCNGILTQKLDASLLDMEDFSKRIIKKMFDISKIGCCFNMMTTRCNFFAPNLFYRHPSEILTYCLSEITHNAKIDHSYGLYEFTVYLYK